MVMKMIGAHFWCVSQSSRALKRIHPIVFLQCLDYAILLRCKVWVSANVSNELDYIFFSIQHTPTYIHLFKCILYIYMCVFEHLHELLYYVNIYIYTLLSIKYVQERIFYLCIAIYKYIYIYTYLFFQAM